MAKMQITESRLNQVISESINEVLMEAQEDEGLGNALGRAWQWGRDKVADFGKQFNAGRNYQRYQHRNADPYGQYGAEANKFRNFGPDAYKEYRQQYLDGLRGDAQQTYDTGYGTVDGSYKRRLEKYPPKTEGPAAEKPAPATDQPESPAAQQPESPAPAVQQPKAQPNQSTQQKQNWVKQGKQQAGRQQAQQNMNLTKQQNAKFLMQKGFKLVNGQWLYTQDGSNSPALQSQYPDIVKAAQDYQKSANNLGGMRESKKSMDAIINESVAKSIRHQLGNSKK